ncbi:MAG: hypothetical protein Q7W30_10565 [Coriobacteriia bacterium]|nr:hypothetical protein [Coriobacteriia bacterium]
MPTDTRTQSLWPSAAFALGLALFLALPALARAAVWTEGTGGRPFSLESRSGLVLTGTTADQSLVLPYRLNWEYSLGGDPRSIRALGNDAVLIADGASRSVFDLTRAGVKRWVYSSVDDVALVAPSDAERLASGNTLIVDRGGFRVLEVTNAKATVWQHGTGIKGTGLGQLSDPASAHRLTNGNTLIVEPGANRVSEITSAGAVAWRYATGLNAPRAAHRLIGGATLITDSGNDRVIEVSSAGAVTWQYGTTKGVGVNQLSGPTEAIRLADGTTLITDKGNNRIVVVSRAKSVVGSYGAGPMLPGHGPVSSPLAALRIYDGSTLVLDGTKRLLVYSYASSGTATSRRLDLSAAGAKKRFTALNWNASGEVGSTILEYAIDGGAWQSAGSSGSFSFPSTAQGAYIRYRVRQQSPALDQGAVLNDVSIVWQAAATQASAAATSTLYGAGSPLTGDTTGFGDGSVVSTAPATLPADGILRGWVMQRIGGVGAGGSGSGTLGVAGSVPVPAQYAGLGLITIVFGSGLAWGPGAKLLPLLARLMSGTLH